MTRTMVVSAYFDGGQGDPKIDYFERLDRALEPHGLRLHLLNLNSRPLKTSCSAESLPRLIEKAHWLPVYRLLGRLDAKPIVGHAASIDALCWQRELQAEAFRVLLFREHLRRLFDRIRPSLYIAWHEFFSLHYTLPAMLREEFPDVPFLFTEFGPLPGTITFDREGQMGESEVATRPDEHLALPVSGEDVENAKKFIERLRSEKRSRKPQTSDADPLAPHREALANAKTVIFYAGQYDCHTGMAPRTLPNTQLHSRLFSGTIDALSFLSELALKNDWLVLFKPHPLESHSENELHAISAPRRVVTVQGANLFECFEISQAVVTIVSQVNYMALIHEKPCVMLGQTYLTGKGCTYEPASRDDVANAIKAAIEHGFTDGQQSAWYRHAAQLLRHTIYGFDPDLDAPGLRGTDAAASFLSESCAAAADVTSASPRDPDAALARDLGPAPARARLFRALYTTLKRY